MVIQMWEVRNKSTGKIMRSFDTKERADKYRKSLNYPNKHQVRKKRQKRYYSYTIDGSDMGVFVKDQQNAFFIDPITGQGGLVNPTTPNLDPIPLDPFPIPPHGGGGGGVGTQPGGTTYPTNPEEEGGTVTVTPGGSGTVQASPQTSTNTSSNSSSMDANVVIDDATSEMSDTEVQSWFEENWPELAIAGAITGVAAGVDLRRGKDKSLIRRLFSASKTKADSVFMEYKGNIRENADDMQELLRRDFARDGPLYKAWQQDSLSLSLGRNEWVAFGKKYTLENFPRNKWPGFATLDQASAAFFVNLQTGKVFTEEEAQSKVKTNRWVRPKINSDQNTLEVTDEAGDRVELRRVRRGVFIEELENTPENIIAGTKWQGIGSAEDELSVLGMQAQEATNERERIEAQLRALEEGGAGLDPLERIRMRRERERRQQASDDAQKLAAEEATAAATAKVEAEEKKKRDRIEKAVQKLGRSIQDNQVDEQRYSVDKQWVDRYVDSGMGGLIPADDIQSYEYEFDPDGSELVIRYTPEAAEKLGYPEGYVERFSRKRLIELNGIPVQYGPGVSAVWYGRNGVKTDLPTWASAYGKSVTVNLQSLATPMAMGPTTDLRAAFSQMQRGGAISGFGRSRSGAIMANNSRYNSSKGSSRYDSRGLLRTRDFGTKHTFFLHWTPRADRTKAWAKKQAEWFRYNGYNARVVKMKGGWGVWQTVEPVRQNKMASIDLSASGSKVIVNNPVTGVRREYFRRG